MKNIVYAIESPIDGKVYYVGQSEKGLSRPYDHVRNSHNKELKAWLNTLKREPIIKILERDCENLLERETYWINNYKNKGEPLFNKIIPTAKQLRYIDYSIGSFIKEKRKSLNLTQKEFADKAGVGLRFLRDVEQGKESCRMDKVLQVLSMFGATLIPVCK